MANRTAEFDVSYVSMITKITLKAFLSFQLISITLTPLHIIYNYL